jgi:hypothetical protein
MNMTSEERSRLDVIEGKVDQILLMLTYMERSVHDHEERLRSVERWKMSIPITMLLTVATLVGAVLRGVVS